MSEATLREVLERLAPLVRRAGSEDEARAAAWLAERMGGRIEEEDFHDGYARLHATFLAVGAAGGILGRRLPGLAAAAAIWDDAGNRRRLPRELLSPKLRTQNVIAEVGAGDRTLVVLAHHDAAPTGVIFDQTLQQAVARRFPDLIERTDTAVPLWWLVAAGPLAVAAGLRRTGTALCLLGAACFADIARDRTVPGANDNLSGVAVLVALGERLREKPAEGLRVLLVSCGAEEVLQGGIHGFVARHRGELDTASTFVLNIDTVASPRLALLEGEGPFGVEDYTDPRFRDLVAGAAERIGVPLRRGLRARTSTDAVVPSRAGYPTATLVSIDAAKAQSNYHLPSDTPENADYGTIARALDVAEAVARELAVSRR